MSEESSKKVFTKSATRPIKAKGRKNRVLYKNRKSDGLKRVKSNKLPGVFSISPANKSDAMRTSPGPLAALLNKSSSSSSAPVTSSITSTPLKFSSVLGTNNSTIKTQNTLSSPFSSATAPQSTLSSPVKALSNHTTSLSLPGSSTSSTTSSAFSSSGTSPAGSSLSSWSQQWANNRSTGDYMRSAYGYGGGGGSTSTPTPSSNNNAAQITQQLGDFFKELRETMKKERESQQKQVREDQLGQGGVKGILPEQTDSNFQRIYRKIYKDQEPAPRELRIIYNRFKEIFPNPASRQNFANSYDYMRTLPTTLDKTLPKIPTVKENNPWYMVLENTSQIEPMNMFKKYRDRLNTWLSNTGNPDNKATENNIQIVTDAKKSLDKLISDLSNAYAIQDEKSDIEDKIKSYKGIAELFLEDVQKNGFEKAQQNLDKKIESLAADIKSVTDADTKKELEEKKAKIEEFRNKVKNMSPDDKSKLVAFAKFQESGTNFVGKDIPVTSALQTIFGETIQTQQQTNQINQGLKVADEIQKYKDNWGKKVEAIISKVDDLTIRHLVECRQLLIKVQEYEIMQVQHPENQELQQFWLDVVQRDAEKLKNHIKNWLEIYAKRYIESNKATTDSDKQKREKTLVQMWNDVKDILPHESLTEKGMYLAAFTKGVEENSDIKNFSDVLKKHTTKEFTEAEEKADKAAERASWETSWIWNRWFYNMSQWLTNYYKTNDDQYYYIKPPEKDLDQMLVVYMRDYIAYIVTNQEARNMYTQDVRDGKLSEAEKLLMQEKSNFFDINKSNNRPRYGKLVEVLHGIIMEENYDTRVAVSTFYHYVLDYKNTEAVFTTFIDYVYFQILYVRGEPIKTMITPILSEPTYRVAYETGDTIFGGKLLEWTDILTSLESNDNWQTALYDKIGRMSRIDPTNPKSGVNWWDSNNLDHIRKQYDHMSLFTGMLFANIINLKNAMCDGRTEDVLRNVLLFRNDIPTPITKDSTEKATDTQKHFWILSRVATKTISQTHGLFAKADYDTLKAYAETDNKDRKDLYEKFYLHEIELDKSTKEVPKTEEQPETETTSTESNADQNTEEQPHQEEQNDSEEVKPPPEPEKKPDQDSQQEEPKQEQQAEEQPEQNEAEPKKE